MELFRNAELAARNQEVNPVDHYHYTRSLNGCKRDTVKGVLEKGLKMSETNFKHIVEDHDEIWSRRVCPSCRKFDPKSVEVTDYSGPEMANFEYTCEVCSVVWTWAEGAPVGNGPDRPPHLDECGICGDWDCEGDCEKRDQESLDRVAYGNEFGSNFDPAVCALCGGLTDCSDGTCGETDETGTDISDWVWKDGIKYPGGDGTVWVSEYAPMRVWEMQAALARLNPTDHVLIAAPTDSRSDWLNIGMVVAPTGPDRENVSAVTLFPGLEWDSFDMAIDWDRREDRGLFR